MTTATDDTAARGQTTRIHTVRAEPLTAEGFAPFGQVIGQNDLKIDARDGEVLHLDILSKEHHSLEITSFNRHFKATQAQIALNGKPSIILVAPPTVDLDKPEHLELIRAFICDGSVGFNLGIGTWHSGAHPLMERLDMVNLQGLHPDVDIEIRDLVKAFGVAVEIRL